MAETVSVDDLKKILEQVPEKIEQVEIVEEIPQAEIKVEIEKKPKKANEILQKQSKPPSMIKTAILLILVILIQAFMSSKYFRVFLAKYIQNPTMALVCTVVLFVAITAGLFFLFTKI